MKRLFLILFAAVAAAGCTDGGESLYFEDMGFMGSVTVTDAYGRITLTGDNINFGVVDEGQGEATLFLYGIKFVDMMPLTDLVVPYVRYTKANGTLVLRDDDIIPLSTEGYPLTDYRIYDLYGELYNGELTLTFSSLGMRISYRGYRISY